MSFGALARRIEEPQTMNDSAVNALLCAQPSWLSGAARTLDLFGVFDSYTVSSTPEEADARALWGDWRTVGDDIVAASETVRGNR